MAPKVRANTLHELGAEPFLAALVRSSDDAIIGKTPDGHVVFWNAAAERLYGYRAAEMLGRDISVLVPEDRPEELAEILAQVADGNVVRALQTERRRKDGAIVPVSVTVSPVMGEDGAVIGASTIARDLSQHVEQVRVLRDAERRAAEALSTLETWQARAPVGLGFVDRDFRIVHMNQMLASTTGSNASDQVGKTVAEIVPEIWPQVEGVYRRVLEQGEAVLNIDVTGELAGEAGGRRDWLASYYPVHLGRMTYMNGAVTRMLGWTVEDLRDKHLHDVIHTRSEDGRPILSEAECAHNRVRTEGQAMHEEDLLFTCKNGSFLPVAYSAAPITGGAVGKGTVIVFRDVTEERRR